MCTYYRYNSTPGISPASNYEGKFGYLDDQEVIRKILSFDDGNVATVQFQIPKMHCSSCIWLLENLQRINPAVIRSRVQFLNKEVNLVFRKSDLSLRGLVEMLSLIGYEPRINLDDLSPKKKTAPDRTYVYKIGIAGFAFGNIMLFSFPEYFSLSDELHPGFGKLFSYLNFGLSLPVLFYCSSQFFRSAWQSVHQRFLNIDVPIAAGILVMFIRSSLEILSGSGSGYFDTMAGLVFFMLVGRWFQEKTYGTLSFDRDYKSFFPVSVMRKRNGGYASIPLSDLKTGDVIQVRNEEVIPADAILIDGSASIDYSFVTGESVPISRTVGDLIYAGGRQKGTMITMKIIKEVSQSYLTQLWNDNRYLKNAEKAPFEHLVNRISHYFTMVIFSVALFALAFWIFRGENLRGWNAFTAVLIIACPCALAISSPFTLGNILRFFGNNQFYLRGYSVIEKLAKVDTVVFDKTGTLTLNTDAEVNYVGEPLTSKLKDELRSLTAHSVHPLSRLLWRDFGPGEVYPVWDYVEVPGKGISGVVHGKRFLMGSAGFVGEPILSGEIESTMVFIKQDGEAIGRFIVKNRYRSGLDELSAGLNRRGIQILVISGDNDHERSRLQKIFGAQARLSFQQRPEQKLQVIQRLQEEGRNVLMVGDGLNDAGALKQADVGVTVSDDINSFSPACDGILAGDRLSRLAHIMKVARSSRYIILASFIIALIYNVIGCWFAVQGALSPVIAAILMPLSTATIIAFTTGMSGWSARQISR